MIASVSTWSAHESLLSGKLDAHGFLNLISGEGAKGVEIVDIDFVTPDLQTISAFQNEAGKHGVEVTCLSLEHSLCRLTAAERQADVENVKRWMSIAKALSVRNVRVFTGWMEKQATYRAQLRWVYEGMRKIADEAERLDLDLVLENHNNVCLAADEIIALMVKVRSPKLFTCPDVFNYKTFAEDMTPVIGDDSFAEIEPLLPFARNAHIKICEAVKNDTEDRYLDISRMIHLFAKYRYNGAVALEYMWPYLKETDDAIEGMRKAIRVLCHHIKTYEEAKGL